MHPSESARAAPAAERDPRIEQASRQLKKSPIVKSTVPGKAEPRRRPRRSPLQTT